MGDAERVCRRSRVLLALLPWLVASACVGLSRGSEFRDLGPTLDHLLVEHDVPGAAFAAFDDTGLIFEHVGGVRSRATDEPVDSDTVFEAASISKPTFAYVVLSLARDGVLDLDAPLGTLVPELPELADDPRAELLTPRVLLTHQGGLPNWRSRLNLGATSYAELFARDDRLAFVSAPGTGYRYSGEGYVLLQRVVEQLTGQGLEALARTRVFEPLGMTRSGFRLEPRMRGNHAAGHDPEGRADKWDLRVPLASSTLHTTATDLARFGAHLAAQIRDAGPYGALASPAVSLAARGDLTRSWGLGLGIVDVGPRRYVYHGGNNVIFIADLLYGVDENVGYVLLTNSANGPGLVKALEQRLFGRDLQR